MMSKLVITEDKTLENIVFNALIKYGIPQKDNNRIILYSVNSLAKKLGMAHKTIKKLCDDRIIRTTKSGRITEDALNDYLMNR